MEISRRNAYIYALILFVSAGLFMVLNEYRINNVRTDISFSAIPLEIAGWKGVNDVFQGKNIYEFIGADVTLLRHYVKRNFEITLYIGYYPEVREGKRPHAARGCYAGQGWSILQDTFVKLHLPSREFDITSLLLKQNDYTQRVFYWFQNSSGEVFSNEIDANKAIFMKKITLKKADIAFIRLSTFVRGSDTVESDMKMMNFVKALMPYLDKTF